MCHQAKESSKECQTNRRWIIRNTQSQERKIESEEQIM